MNIGKLYQVKKLCWMLFPSKEIAATTSPPIHEPSTVASVATATAIAAYYSEKYNCYVSYISAKSIFMLLEKDGDFIKILSTNGEVGWINLADWCKNDIEEVNQ